MTIRLCGRRQAFVGGTPTIPSLRCSRRGTSRIAGGVRPTNPATATYSLRHGEQDQTYYRVCCRGPAGEQVFDLYHDAVTNQWVLDVAHD